MKTINVSPHSPEIEALLQQAREEDFIVRSVDGSEFMLVAMDDFDEEIVRTRKNTRLMALLEERARQTETVPLAEVKRQLGLGE
jgi:hypothetical protein